MRKWAGRIVAALLIGCGARDPGSGNASKPFTIRVDPDAVTLSIGSTQRFTATVQGTSDTSIAWSVVEGAEGGSIAPDGLYTAPRARGTFHVIAVNAADPSKSASAVVVVVSASPSVSIALSPQSTSLLPLGATRFTASVSGMSDRNVIWTIREGAVGGTLAPDGRYTAPGSDGLFHVIATSQADPTNSAVALVSVAAIPRVDVSLEPPYAVVGPGGAVRFTALVAGTSDVGVSWSADGGSVDQGGLFVAPSSDGVFQINATSVADPRRLATATVVVSKNMSPVIAVSLNPGSPIVNPGATVQFTARIEGTTDTHAHWSATGGMMQQDGSWRAPQTGGTFHITVQSLADPTKTADTKATVPGGTGDVAISIEPNNLAFEVGMLTYYQFKAHVTGTADTEVIWSIEEAPGGGSIDAAGGYTPPQTPGLFHVVARSHEDPSKTASAVVAISYDLIDHGGPVAALTRTFALWWGDTSAFAADARPTLERFLVGLDGSSYLAIADQYMRGSRVKTSFAGSLFDTSAPPTDDPAPEMIVQAACQALSKNGASPQSGDLVFVNTSTFPRFADYARHYCGWHYWGTCAGQPLLVAYIPNAAGSDCQARRDFCGSGRSMSTLSLITLTAHEGMEAITDPFGSSWYRDHMIEMTDMCGQLACVSLPTGTFDVPLQYSNATHGCVSH